MPESTWDVIYDTLDMIRTRERTIQRRVKANQYANKLMCRHNQLSADINRGLRRLKPLLDSLRGDALLVHDHVFYLDSDDCVTYARVQVGTGISDLTFRLSDDQIREAAQREAAEQDLVEAAEAFDSIDDDELRAMVSGSDGTAIRTAWGTLRCQRSAPEVP